jgi:enamine deaminase RidA (YjgF/YER057c/UK114 family)
MIMTSLLISLRSSTSLRSSSSLRSLRSIDSNRLSLSTLSNVEKKVIALGLKVPEIPPAPKGSYTQYVRTGNIVYLAGHLPQTPEKVLLSGRLGENMSIEEGQIAARYAALQMLATLKAATGNLDKVKKVIKLVGFVNSTNDFQSQHLVLNGASNFMGDVFGLEIGRHARSGILLVLLL